jgi:hypothetical protein
MTKKFIHYSYMQEKLLWLVSHGQNKTELYDKSDFYNKQNYIAWPQSIMFLWIFFADFVVFSV